MVGERPGSNESNPADLICTLSEEAALQRREHLAGTVFDEMEDIEEHQTGYTLTFPGTTETVEAVLTFIGTDRTCCPFSRFELEVPPNNGPCPRRVSCPDGAKDLIERELPQLT